MVNFDAVGVFVFFIRLPCGRFYENLQPFFSNSCGMAVKSSRLASMLEVHSALCQLIAPATPVTIRASKIDGKIWIDNVILRLLLSLSFLSLLMFLGTAVWKEKRVISSETGVAAAGTNTVQSTNAMVGSPGPGGTKSAGGSTTTSPAPSGRTAVDILMILAAAGLGAGFYGLYTAHSYIAAHTFDPKYNPIYLVRYVLGLTSGTILGYFGTSLFQPDAARQFDPKQFAPPVFALVGGYAAEAVSQILQRIADTLVALGGNNDDAVQAKKKELEAATKQQESQRKIEMLKPLQEAKEAIIKLGPAASADAQNAIQKVMDALVK